MVDFIVDSNLSFNVVQKPALRKLLRKLLENVSGRQISIPTSKRFMSKLSTMYDEVKAELKRTLKTQKYVCVTSDVWSARGYSYIGITVHFINAKYERKSYVLAFRPITGKQSYDVLTKIITNVFKEYDLEVCKITHIVTVSH